MAIQTYKDILPQFASIRPMNLYKEWILTDSDFTTHPTLKEFMSASAASASWSGTINSYYAQYSGSIPNFPGLNIKYARYYSSETGSVTDPNTDVIDFDGTNDYVLSYNYSLGNGDKFYPLYQSQSGWVNPDGSYARLIHYSLKKLFYSNAATHYNLLFGTSNQLSNEAIVIEIPQRFVADTIEPGTFTLIDASDIYRLPYSTGSWEWAYPSGSNNIIGNPSASEFNPLASEGIKLFDDTHGNLYDYNYHPSIQRGNIFYEMGLVVITDIKYAQYFRNYLILSGNIL
jgi:hypothetical protein